MPFIEIDLTNTSSGFVFSIDGAPFVAAALPPADTRRIFSHEDVAAQLPRWMLAAAITPVTEDGVEYTAEDSLYAGILESGFPSADSLLHLLSTLSGASVLAEKSITIPRLVWACPGVRLAGNSSVAVSLEGATMQVQITTSEYVFMTSPNPVCILSSDSTLCLRNIAQRSYSAVTLDGEFDISGDPPVDDEDIWIYSEDTWQPASETAKVDIDALTITVPGTGLVTYKYASEERAALLTGQCIVIDEQPPTAPTATDLWNIFDETAMLAGIERLPGETNRALSDRVRTSFSLAGTAGRVASAARVGHSFGLVGAIRWDGGTTLSLSDHGVTGATCLLVKGLARKEIFRGSALLPNLDRTTFCSDHALWDDGAEVYVDGSPVTSLTRPDMSVSDGMVNFGSEEMGEVTATYTVTRYGVSDAGGLSVVPNSNTPPGDYLVIYVRGLSVYQADDEEFQQTHLIDEDGRPTEDYSAVARALKSSIPIAVGDAEWGSGAHWFARDNLKPKVTYLPIILT